MTSPINASRAVPSVTFPSDTSVAGFATIIPAPFIPISVIKIPMPAATAFLRFTGIESIIASRVLKRERARNSNPSKNTAVKATAGEYFIVSTTVNVKNAFSPIPGASAIGRFAVSPIKMEAIAAAIAVAVNTEAALNPALLSMSGLTAKIYAIAKNVVIPATISVRTVVLFALSLKNCSINKILLKLLLMQGALYHLKKNLARLHKGKCTK